MTALRTASRLFTRARTVVNARILKKWGTPATKKAIWDDEFSNGQWDYLTYAADDPIYDYLARYAHNGSILDLGCGASNTGHEMDVSTYSSYTGVDISEQAIRRALARTLDTGRHLKNHYACSEMSSYIPIMRYDIILFRESLFYVPTSHIKRLLDRYVDYLKRDGVFIVRMYDRRKHAPIVQLIERCYNVLERSSAHDLSIILVFKPYPVRTHHGRVGAAGSMHGLDG